MYDDNTAAFVREAPAVSIDSHTPKAVENADGLVGVYFAPQTPANHADNWLATNKAGRWSAIFRLYGPTKAFYQKL